MKELRYAFILIVVQVYRVGGVLFLFELQRGTLPATFAVPAGVGDILIGITAPLIGLALRSGGSIAWATAITWNALGIIDLIYAITLGVLSQAQYILTSYLAVVPFFLVPLSIIIHIAAIIFLLQKGSRKEILFKSSND
jgi:hypothetical protein